MIAIAQDFNTLPNGYRVRDLVNSITEGKWAKDYWGSIFLNNVRHNYFGNDVSKCNFTEEELNTEMKDVDIEVRGYIANYILHI